MRRAFMRRAFLLVGVPAGLALAAACASSEEDLVPPEPNAAPQPAPQSDADTGTDGDGGAPSIRDASTCSEAGWCLTVLPDPDLVLKDIWAFESRAFAIAESETFGVKVLEWESASQAWKYIDDNTQNEYGLGKFAGKIWAPNENEVYYGVAPGLIYHGVRANPSSPWSWQRDQLDDNSRDTDPTRDHGLAYYYDRGHRLEPAFLPAVGVWGTSAEDVYAWYANTIFHREREDGGAPVWVPQYVLEDLDEDAGDSADVTYILSAAGSGADDVWFASGRIRYGEARSPACPVMIHKTPDGYRRLVDSVIDTNDRNGFAPCLEKPGALQFEDGFYIPFTIPGFVDAGYIYNPYRTHALVTNIDSAGPNAIIGVLEGDDEALVYVTTEDGGLARRSTVESLTLNGNVGDALTGPVSLYSVWHSGTDAWVSTWGAVLRFDDNPVAWRKGMALSAEGDTDYDGGRYRTSTVAIDGVPISARLHQVRGTSTSNLWAIGAGHALHKTTP